jgi:hypothetical protein
MSLESLVSSAAVICEESLGNLGLQEPVLMQPCLPAFKPLGLNEIHPTGWLRRQLRIQADGLTGHIDEFWPDIQRSAWIGGDREGWERGPYWLDGLVPLAALLDDQRLREKVGRWFDYILSHQQEDGWLGPLEPGPAANREAQKRDPWPIFLILKAAMQYHSAFGDDRILPAMLHAARAVNRHLNGQPMAYWAFFRAQDFAVSLLWLAERDPEHADELLWIARRALRQTYDWISHFREMPYRQKCDAPAPDRYGTSAWAAWAYDNHVVNHAMAMKVPAILHRLGMLDDAETVARLAITQLDRYHGQATGMFSGDESLAGLMPSQGVELCAVVENLYSLEYLAATFATPEFGDRLERIAFNALPATFSPDMWTHQYVQQPNQVLCAHIGTDDFLSRIYTNNGTRANCFGLEPNFGCCTANMHQGWPKFASHLWMRTAGPGPDSLAAVAWAPCRIETTLGSAPATLDVVTGYPFCSGIDLRLTVARSVEGGLHLRIPSWATGATVAVDGEQPQGAKPGTYHVLRRRWTGRHSIHLDLPMQPRLERRFNNAAAIHRGPLVYGLKIDDRWQPLPPLPTQVGRQDILDHPDFEVHPTSPWNYALDLDEKNLASALSFEERAIGECPFSPDGAPVVARVRGRRLPAWGLEKNAVAPPPPSPVRSTEPEETVTLIPYGCTNLRVTEFPTLGGQDPHVMGRAEQAVRHRLGNRPG